MDNLQASIETIKPQMEELKTFREDIKSWVKNKLKKNAAEKQKGEKNPEKE